MVQSCIFALLLLFPLPVRDVSSTLLNRFKAERDGQVDGQVTVLTASCVIMKNNIYTYNQGGKCRPPVKESKLIKELLQSFDVPGREHFFLVVE